VERAHGDVGSGSLQGEKELIGDVILENIAKKVYILMDLFVGRYGYLERLSFCPGPAVFKKKLSSEY